MLLETKKYAWYQFIDDLSKELRDEYLTKHDKYNEKEFNIFFKKAQDDLKKDVELDKSGILECLLLFNDKDKEITKLKKIAENILLKRLENNFKGTLLHSV